jgi:CRISPR-associated protein Cas1
MDRGEATGSLTSTDVADGQDAVARTFSRGATEGPVAVLDGYGVELRVRRGHLEAVDGIGRHRRQRRWSRADRSLRRVVVLGEGTLSTEALRYCRAVGAAVVVLDDDKVTLASSPPGLDDARLRRAQATAPSTEVGLAIVRHLLGAKLAAQGAVVRTQLDDPGAAEQIETLADALGDAIDVERARQLEAVAAASYFAAWPQIEVVRFVTADARRVPSHWRRFDGRRSHLRSRNSNQRAERPLNAILNYCYRLAEMECRLAALAVGLDPGLGFLHTDYPGRDALALDLLEPVRAEVERYVLRLVRERRFRKADFVELPDGHVRVLAPLTHVLAQTMPAWAQAVAPHAEAVAHALAELVPGKVVRRTPLTATRRRQAVRGMRPTSRRVPSPPLPLPSCRSCGALLERADYLYCEGCRPAIKEKTAAGARAAQSSARARRRKSGEREPWHSPAAAAKRTTAIGRRNREALEWEAASGSPVIDPAAFEPIRQALATVSVSRIASASGLSRTYAADVRRGRYVPHPRHWPVLADLAGVACPPLPAHGENFDLCWWRQVVVPALATVTPKAMSEVTGLSPGSCSKIRAGKQVPQPRLWRDLARLAGVDDVRPATDSQGASTPDPGTVRSGPGPTTTSR